MSVTERFELAACEHADRLAVKSSRHAWSYDELNRNAKRLAHAIQAANGPACTPVAMLFDHDAPAIAAILGILMAGKFYASLDIAAPPARNSAIIASLGATLLVCDRTNLPAAIELANGRCGLLVYEAVEASSSSETLCQAIDPAFPRKALPLGVFFTSGSTGQPKGVLWQQHLSLHRVRADLQDIAVVPGDRHTLLTSMTFPASSSDINLALLNGASLHLYDVRKFGATYLADWLRQERITCLRAPVTLFRTFLDSLVETDFFAEVRAIGLGGDVLYRKDVESAWRHFSSDCRIVHRYTITEAGMVARRILDADAVLDSPVIPAGLPIPDKCVTLVDEAGRNVPPGQPGEIAVSSRFLATEYWGQPELTRQSFLPTPNAVDSVTYLTGDLGRWRPDGCLELLGRKDFRLKIRGYRIEPSTVEVALRAVDGILDAVVVARSDYTGVDCLVAYVVPAGMPVPEARRLRDRLAENLPAYMLPAAYVFLDAFPLTCNGKVDRQRLPVIYPRPVGSESERLAPRTPVEHILSEIFSDVLRLKEMDVEDNFFDLGGHSLLAARVIARANEQFGISLPLRDFFNSPTIAGLAKIIESGIRPLPVRQVGGNEAGQLQVALRLLDVC